jgi:hypothetical protein
MTKQYLFRMEVFSKKDKNPLESIAYYSGEKQFDLKNAKSYETTTDEKVIWNKIVIPDRTTQTEKFNNLPDYLRFRTQKTDIISNARNILWKDVNNREIRPDSQFARLFEFAIPYFLTNEESTKLITSFANVLVHEGMIVDSSLHSHNLKKPLLSIFERMKMIQNPKPDYLESLEKPQDYTAFLMCTLRDYEEGRFVNKNREWNDKLKLKEWRKIWLEMLCETMNNASNATEEDKNSWETKLNIYPEYKKSMKKLKM